MRGGEVYLIVLLVLLFFTGVFFYERWAFGECKAVGHSMTYCVMSVGHHGR